MLSDTYKIAGHVIEINSLYDQVHTLCREYRCTGTAEIHVSISHEDIAYERIRSEEEDRRDGIPVRQSSDSYLETLAVYRKIAEAMVEFDTVLFHGSAVAVDGEGYLFAAKSGTGKSTHTRLWRQVFGDRAQMINDDKPLLHITDNGVTVYGTPWNGKHGLGSNISVPLKGLCILSRGKVNQIHSVSPARVIASVLQQTYRPHDSAKLAKTLELVDRLMIGTRLYQLQCNMEEEAAIVSYNAMQ